MDTPVIILVNPQMGENIGAAARAMMNFGLRDLRLVAPRDGWPNPKAEEMAAHGETIIHNAKVYPTTRNAVADLHYVYASTARDRRMQKPQLTPAESAEDGVKRIHDGQRIGILFGPERSGLTNEDIALAHAILTIPTDEKYASLNIAQSSVVIAYEWWVHKNTINTALSEPDGNKISSFATGEEIHAFFDHLEQALDASYFFKLEEKKPRMWQNLRATFLRAGLSSQEVHTLRGVIAALAKDDK